MNRTTLSALLLIFLSTSAYAKELACSIHPSKQLSDSELIAMARVSQAEARKTALSNVNMPSASVIREKLDVHEDCLVYKFDIKVPDTSGSEQLLVDAGTGTLLSREHNNAVEEMMEKTKDKLKKAY